MNTAVPRGDRGRGSREEVQVDSAHASHDKVEANEALESFSAVKLILDMVLLRGYLNTQDLFRLRATSVYCKNAVQSHFDKAKHISFTNCPPWINSAAFTAVALTNKCAQTLRVERKISLEHDMFFFVENKRNLRLIEIANQPISSDFLCRLNECCPELTRLVLSSCSNVPENGVELLAQNPMLNLQYLQLTGNKFKWNGLQLGQLMTSYVRLQKLIVDVRFLPEKRLLIDLAQSWKLSSIRYFVITCAWDAFSAANDFHFRRETSATEEVQLVTYLGCDCCPLQQQLHFNKLRRMGLHVTYLHRSPCRTCRPNLAQPFHDFDDGHLRVAISDLDLGSRFIADARY